MDMQIPTDIEGRAALAICESLLLALSDRRILPESEIQAILVDAAAAHANAPPGDGKEEMHRQVAALIQRIIDAGKSSRY